MPAPRISMATVLEAKDEKGSNEDFEGFRNIFSKPRDFSSAPLAMPWVKLNCSG